MYIGKALELTCDKVVPFTSAFIFGGGCVHVIKYYENRSHNFIKLMLT
jgi:hypothetical protein